MIGYDGIRNIRYWLKEKKTYGTIGGEGIRIMIGGEGIRIMIGGEVIGSRIMIGREGIRIKID